MTFGLESSSNRAGACAPAIKAAPSAAVSRASRAAFVRGAFSVLDSHARFKPAMSPRLASRKWLSRRTCGGDGFSCWITRSGFAAEMPGRGGAAASVRGPNSIGRTPAAVANTISQPLQPNCAVPGRGFSKSRRIRNSSRLGDSKMPRKFGVNVGRTRQWRAMATNVPG